MRVLLLCAVAVVAVVAMTGCATGIFPGGPTPAGIIYTNMTSPAQNLAVSTDPSAKPTKTGKGTVVAILGLVSQGDAGIEAAMKDGGITRIQSVDHNIELYVFGILVKETTIVHGD